MRYSLNKLTPHVAGPADYQRTPSRGGPAPLAKRSRMCPDMLRGSIFAAAVVVAACACAAPSQAPATPGVASTTTVGATPTPTPPESTVKPAPTPGGPVPTVVGRATEVNSPAATPSPGTTAQVMITVERTFDPPTVTIRTGEAIEWVNLNRSPQTVTDDPAKVAAGADAQLPAGASPIDSGVLNSGQSFIYRFDTPGAYTYTSLPGEQQGMLGRVVVN
jgi:plastocyanin